MALCVIGIKDLKQYLENGGILIDLRSEKEYKRFHIPGAHCVPEETLEKYMWQAGKEKQYIFYCAHGSSSFYYGKLYARQGYRVCTLAGGLDAYINRKDFPLSEL